MLLRELVDAATPRDAAKVVGPPLPRSAPQRRAPEAEAGPAPEAETKAEAGSKTFAGTYKKREEGMGGGAEDVSAGEGRAGDGRPNGP